MKTLIVYYSRTGTTRKLAEELARELNADTEEIVDLKNRKGAFGFLSGGRDAMKGNLTNIEMSKKNPADYDLVLVGSPVWAGNLTPAARAYVRCNRDRFGHVACFCTMGSKDFEKTFSEFEKELGKSPISTLSFQTKEFHQGINKDKIIDFTKNLKERFPSRIVKKR